MRLIDADAFIKENQEIIDCEIDHPKYQDTLRELINTAPTVERPHGEWLSHYEYCKKHDCIPSGLIAFWWCNQCEQGVEIPTNFCPNCGADMRPKEGDT